jgi:hypothetical protein
MSVSDNPFAEMFNRIVKEASQHHASICRILGVNSVTNIDPDKGD